LLNKGEKKATITITNTSTTTTSMKISASSSSVESLPILPVNGPKKNILNNSTELIKSTAKKVFSYSMNGSSKRDSKISPLTRPVSTGGNSKITNLLKIT
jgi:hypothetical protein